MVKPREGRSTYQALSVLTNDDTVNELVIVLGATHANHRSDVGIEIQLLPELDNGRAVTLDLVRWARDRTKHGTVAVRLERLDSLLGQRRSGLLEVLEASVKVNELELGRTGRVLQHTLGAGEHLASNAVGGHHTQTQHAGGGVLEDLGGCRGHLWESGRETD